MQVATWGNSLAVRLSKALVEELGLQAGDEIDIVAATTGRLFVEKKRATGSGASADAGSALAGARGIPI